MLFHPRYGHLHVIALLTLSGCHSNDGERETVLQAAVSQASLSEFAAHVEDLRMRLEIPSLSAGIVRDGDLVWAKGFGYADPEEGVPATPETPYHLASLTKTFTSTIMLQLVEEGRISLDDSIAKYGIDIGTSGDVRLRHLLSHTSDDPPGSFFRYDGNRFGTLGTVIEQVTGKPLWEAVQERIVSPLELTTTVPGDAPDTYPDVFAALARPYEFDESHTMVVGEYPVYFDASAGLISTVTDLARFVSALGNGELLSPAMEELAFTPNRTTDGEQIPYGFGWFSQEYRGVRLVWAFGYWFCNSSLMLTLPDQGLTLIALANTDGLSSPFPIGLADALVIESPLALEFLRSFVLDATFPDGTPTIDWSQPPHAIVNRLRTVVDSGEREFIETEIRGRWAVANHVGNRGEADRYLDVFYESFGLNDDDVFGGMPELARIDSVRFGDDRTADFDLRKDTRVRIYAIGDGPPWSAMFDDVWIENAATRDTLWMMHGTETVAAGGHMRNRKADLHMDLPAGRYRLHFKKTVFAHSWDQWEVFPPTHRFLGAVVLNAEDGA